MNKQLFPFLLTALMSMVGAKAYAQDTQTKRTIHVETAGTLPDLIPADEKYQIEELTLSGELNGTDFIFIREMAGDAASYKDTPDEAEVYHNPTEGILKSLDISNATIVGGGKAYNYVTVGTDILELHTSNNRITGGLFDRTNLETIVLPNNVTSIEHSEYFGEKPQTEYIGAFPKCLTSIEIPITVTRIDKYAFYGCENLESINVKNGNQYYDSRNNCNALIETSSNTLIMGCKNSVIPSSVTSIGENAFYGCKGLTHISIPNGVTSIGENAFYNCIGLIFVTIPNSVTSISSFAFRHCSSLATIISNIKHPFEISEFIFPKDAELIVPAGTQSVYQDTKGWSKFINITEATASRAIHVEIAGTLPDLIPADDKYQIEELTLTGELNGTDFNFLRNMAGVTLDRMEAEYMATLDTETAGKLRVLDLSDAKIVEGGRDYYRMMTSSAMNTYDHYQYTKPDSVTTCMFADFKTLEELVLPRSVKFISGDAFCDIIAVGFPVNLKVLKVADGNLYYDSRDNCNAVIKKGTNELIAGCQATIIHNDVTSIGDNAFRYRQSLTSIDIPNSVTTIGAYAFSSSGLTSIDLPSSITSIGDYAFSWCKSLTSFEIPDGITSISAGVFCASTVLSSIKIPGSVTAIGRDAFYSCSGLTSIEIPSNVTTIGSNAFNYCSGLTSIEIPSNVTTIGSTAFNFCNGLTSIKIPSSVTAIGSFAFKNCNNLNYVVSEITEPFSVTNDIFPNVILFVPTGTSSQYKETEGWATFSEIIEGTPIETNNGHLKYICAKESKTARVFPDKSYQDLTEVIIPSTINLNKDDYDVVSIGRGSFSGCSNLTSMVISNGISAFGEEAFLGCSGLTSLDIPNSVTSIGAAAFKNCSGLTSISIPSNITTISRDLFSGCSSLTSLEIPDGVSTIGSNAFSGCKSLLSINIPKNITTIESYTFYNCSSLTSLEIPNSVTSIWAGAFSGCSSLTSFKIPDDVTTIEFSAFYGCSNLSSLILPHGITAIKGSTFKDCKSLTSIRIPRNVTTIDYWAFQNCESLISIEIPSSVKTIGVSAFDGCSRLTSVTVDIQKPLAISSNIFSNRANATLYVPKGSKSAYDAANYWKDFKEIKEFVKDNEVTCEIDDENAVTATAANDPTEKDVVIPESVMIDGEAHPVTAIGDEAFKDNTSMALVCIPETIEEIGEGAFAGCSGLTAIYSYNENPIPLGSANATVRSRADGNEVAASTVFAEVDKDVCILYVPKNCSDKYRNAEGWKEFQNIVEIQSSEPGDANNDTKVDSKDINATVDYIMEGKTKDFIFKNADVKTDSKINAADIVEIVNIKK